MEVPLIDILWVLVSAGLVFLMQAGFLCLETGLTRSKNNINVALKNLTDLGISIILFWLFGYGLMFGQTWGGWLGSTDFLPDFNNLPPWSVVFFLFQVMFCGTAVTILSGAVAERMRFDGYVISAALVSGIIYPIFGHWVWNGLATGQTTGWLGTWGFVDFAGSTVVHSVGGWVALATLLVIGPRDGRFPADGPPRAIPGSNLPLATLGAMLLWFGWFGFNGGSTLAMNDQVPLIIANTMMAAGAGMFSTLLISWLWRGQAQVSLIMNGSLAGLVAITANAHSVSSLSAVIIGGVGGLVMVAADKLLLHYRIDDAIGAIPVHLAAGIWGTLAVAFFGEPAILGTGLNFSQQLQSQLIGIMVCGLWAFGVTYIILSLINPRFPLRVTPEMEQIGLNVSEHGATTEILDLFTVMDEQAHTGDLSLRVPVEPFTEVGQIAQRYNRVMDFLEEAIAKTEAIVHSSMDGIVTFTRGTLSIISLNPAAETIFGYAPEVILGQPVTRLFQDPHQKTSQFLIEDIVVAETRYEMLGQRADGSTFPLEVMLSEARAGQEAFYTGTFRDITERKQAEESLRQKNDYLAALHDTTLGLISRLEVHDLLEALISRAAQMLQATHGAIYLAQANQETVELKVGIGVFSQLIGEQLQPGQGLCGKIWQTGQPLVVNNYDDWPGRDPYFESHTISSTVGVPLISDSQVMGVMTVAYSIESNQTIEAADVELLNRFAELAAVALHNARLYSEVQAARDIAEAANEMKSAFLANVSHELRTPLTSVLGFAKIIHKRLDLVFDQVQSDDRKTKRAMKQISQNIEIIISEGERLTTLINGVLDLAKIEAGRVEWRMEQLAIAEILNRATTATTALLEKKTVELVQEIEPNLPCITGDQDRLIQVVINLISNAVKFTDQGNITCRAVRQEEQIVVSVIDTGWGISPADQAMVFEKFKQVGDTLTDKPQGTGLGLPICQQIIEHHGGRIWVESEVGQGSNFSFSLPIAAEQPPSQPERIIKTLDINNLLKQLQNQAATQSTTTGVKTILVVDDEASIRELLRQELEAKGYRIYEAVDGLDALKKIKQLQPDLITLDVMMPKMNGFDAAAVLKNDPATANIPIIILSIVEDETRGYRIGVDRYLHKPLNTDHLFAEIETLLEQGGSKKKVLVVDENQQAVRTLSEVLQAQGYTVMEALNDQELLDKAMQDRPDMIIVNSVLSERHADLVKSLRFEKEFENVLIFFFQETVVESS